VKDDDMPQLSRYWPHVAKRCPWLASCAKCGKRFSEGEQVWLYKRAGKRGGKPGKYVCLECERKGRY